MKNKGFTLVELLGVIVLLTVILLITIPAISNALKKGREAADKQLEDSIILSAKNWSADYKLEMPADGRYTVVTNKDLQDGGYIERNLTKPSTKEAFNNFCVKISRKQAALYYDLVSPCPNTADGREVLTYKCPDGYNTSGSGSSTSCTRTVKTYTSNIYNADSYKCPSSYTASSANESYYVNNTSCIHQVLLAGADKCREGEVYESTPANTSSYTSQGYSCKASGSGDMSACYSSDSTSVSIPTYMTCTKTVASAVRSAGGYSCPSGYSSEGSGASMKCYKNTAQSINPNVTKSLECPPGYDQVGSQSNLRCVSN